MLASRELGIAVLWSGPEALVRRRAPRGRRRPARRARWSTLRTSWAWARRSASRPSRSARRSRSRSSWCATATPTPSSPPATPPPAGRSPRWSWARSRRSTGPALAAVVPERHRPHRPPGRRRQRAVQGPPPRGVRGDGQRLRARRAPHPAAPGRPHEHGRGRDKGNELDAGGPRGAEGLAPELRGQRRGARHLHRQGGRGRDGRLHGQRGPEGEREPGRVALRRSSARSCARTPVPQAVGAGCSRGAFRAIKKRTDAARVRGRAASRGEGLLRDRPRPVDRARDHARRSGRRRVLHERGQRRDRGRAARASACAAKEAAGA